MELADIKKKGSTPFLREDEKKRGCFEPDLP